MSEKKNKFKTNITLDIDQSVDFSGVTDGDVRADINLSDSSLINVTFKGRVKEGGVETPMAFRGETKKERELQCFEHICEILATALPLVIKRSSESPVEFLSTLAESITQITVLSSRFMDRGKIDIDSLVDDVASLIKRHVLCNEHIHPLKASQAPQEPTEPNRQPTEPNTTTDPNRQPTDPSHVSLAEKALYSGIATPEFVEEQKNIVKEIPDDILRLITKDKEYN